MSLQVPTLASKILGSSQVPELMGIALDSNLMDSVDSGGLHMKQIEVLVEILN